MANVNGVRLTLPDGTTFFGEGNLSVQVEHSNQFILSGGNTVIAAAETLFDKLGSGDIVGTPLATGHLGAGAGTRIFEIAFDQWEGSTNDWGPANNDDSIAEKLAVLEHELAVASIDSRNPATLETGPYSSTSSRYDPINVVFPQISPSLDFGESSSIFRPRMTCAETIDLGAAIDGAGEFTEDFRLTPAGDSAPRFSLPADTLGAGGRATGAQQQGKQTARSSLVDTNGSGADPTSLPTSITPEEVHLRGAWRGSEAAALADQFKTDILANDAVEKVDITAPGRSGPTPLTGTYTIEPESSIDPLTPQLEGGVYGFDLQLVQG